MKKTIVILVACLLVGNAWGQKKNATSVVSSTSSAPIKITKMGADTLKDVPAAEYPPKLVISDLFYTNEEDNDFVSPGGKGYLHFNIRNDGQGNAYNLRLRVSENNGVGGLKYSNYKFITQQLNAGEMRTDSIPIEGSSGLQEGKVNLELVLSESNGYKSRPTTVSLVTRGESKYDIDILDYDIYVIKEPELRIRMTVKNTGISTLKDAKVKIDYPKAVYVKGDNVKTLDILKPDESEEVNFTFAKNQYFDENRKELFRLSLEDNNGRLIGMQRDIALVPNNGNSNNGNSNTGNTTGGTILTSDVDIDIPRTTVTDLSMTNDHTYVLAIGNQKYIGNQEVPNAANDARIFTEYCYRTFNIPRGNIILLTNATGNQMKEGLRALVRKATYDTEEKADLIVYYSGHGVIAKDRYGMSDTEFDQYFIPVDVSGADASLSLSRKDIYTAFNAVPFNRASLFLDACNIPIDRAVTKVAKYDWKGNVFVFASSSPSESSISYQEKNHGLFTYYLLKSIKEKGGNINYEDLTNQVKLNVKRQSDSMSGKTQTPEIITSPQAGDSWVKWKISK